MVMKLETIVYLLFVCLSLSSSLKVRNLESGTVSTYLSTVKFEGLTFNKRAVNVSVPCTASFEVSEVENPASLLLTWFHEGEKFSVTRYNDGDPATKTSSPYSTEVYSREQLTLIITLHLTSKNLLPGNYTFHVSTSDKSVVSVSGFAGISGAPLLPLFNKPKRILEGDILRLVCRVISYPKPKSVSWNFSPIPTNQMDDDGALFTAFQQLSPLLTNASHYVLETSEGGVPDDTLRFIQLHNADNGLYSCNVSTDLGDDYTLILVNVKDRWAAMWPFIGIVIEVTVLVIAILLYERHQMRSKPNLTAKVDLGTGGQDASSPGVKVQGQTVQSNNLTVPVHAPETGNDNPVEGNGPNIPSNTELKDTKIEEIRLRSSAK